MLTILGQHDRGRRIWSLDEQPGSSRWKWIKYSYELQKQWGKWLWARFEYANHLSLIACFISSEKWVQRDKYPDNTSLPWQKTGVPNNTTMVQTNTILCQFHHNCVVQIHVGSLFLLVHVRFLQSALVFWVKGNIYMTQHHGAFSKRWSSTTANAATYSSLTKTQQVVGPRWKGVGPTKADQDLSFCVAITPH